ncbi:MAG: CoA transferase [Thermomicrobiales bacterium]
MTGTFSRALEQAVAGPLCTRHLADLGADVIKIERPGSGDFARLRHDGQRHVVLFRLAEPQGSNPSRSISSSRRRSRSCALIAQSDVLVQNLGPGAIDRPVSTGRVAQAIPRAS